MELPSGDVRKFTIAQVASIGALAYVMSFVKIPFPPLPYLVFDLGEIPVITLALVSSLQAGLAASIVYYGILNVTGEFVPIGPLMKLIAVASLLVGLYPIRRSLSRARIASSFALASAIRISVMTLANYVVICILFPGFLDMAAKSLSVFLGQRLLDPISLVMIFTGFFNLIHTIVSFFPSVAAAKLIRRG